MAGGEQGQRGLDALRDAMYPDGVPMSEFAAQAAQTADGAFTPAPFPTTYSGPEGPGAHGVTVTETSDGTKIYHLPNGLIAEEVPNGEETPAQLAAAAPALAAAPSQARTEKPTSDPAAVPDLAALRAATEAAGGPGHEVAIHALRVAEKAIDLVVSQGGGGQQSATRGNGQMTDNSGKATSGSQSEVVDNEEPVDMTGWTDRQKRAYNRQVHRDEKKEARQEEFDEHTRRWATQLGLDTASTMGKLGRDLLVNRYTVAGVFTLAILGIGVKEESSFIYHLFPNTSDSDTSMGQHFHDGRCHIPIIRPGC